MTRGGARKGAGRPKGQGKFKEPTQVLRVPISLVKEIKAYTEMQGFKLPLFSSRVQAGYGSPAEEHVEDHIDLARYLVDDPLDTFLVHATGHSMIDAGIRDGDLLVVNRRMTPTHGKIVVAAVDGSVTVKFLIIRKGKPFLVPANPAFDEMPVDPENGVLVWGVVTKSIQSH